MAQMVEIEAPAVTPLPGGLLAVANVVDSADPHIGFGGTFYLSEACGVAGVLPGGACGMAGITITSTGAATATVTLSPVPGGRYILALDGGTAQVAQGPSPTWNLTGLTNGSHEVVVSGGQYDGALDFTWPLTAPVTSGLAFKAPVSIDVVEGSPFSIFKSTECTDLHDDDEAWVRRALALGEAHAVEYAFMRAVLAGANTEKVNGDTAVSLINGIAMLEGYAADHYGGVPTIHMPRSVATRAAAKDAIQPGLDFTMTTKQGSLVANGGGYSINIAPDGTPAAAGTAWLYATGAVTLARTPVQAHRVLDHTKNNQVALAERTYVPSVDCFVAAVLVTLEANDG